MVRLADIPPGSYAHDPDTKKGVFRLPSGRGWWQQVAAALPTEEQRDRLCDVLRRDGGRLWPSALHLMTGLPDDLDVREVATGLTIADFADAAALERALKARGIGSPVRVGDSDLCGKDLPGCCIVRSHDSNEIAHVKSDRSYAWLDSDKPSAYHMIELLNSSRWEVLATHVPDDATRDQARAAAGLGAPAAATVKVGDTRVPAAQVPEGAVVQHPSGDVYHVRKARAIQLIRTHDEEHDQLSRDRTLEQRDNADVWKILALGVPVDATAEQARQAAGLAPLVKAAVAAGAAKAPADGIYATERGAIYVSEGGARTWLADHAGDPERRDLYEAGEPCPRGHLDGGPRLVSGKPAQDRLVAELRDRAEVDAALLAWPTTAAAAERFAAVLEWRRAWARGEHPVGAIYAVMGLHGPKQTPIRVFADQSGHDPENTNYEQRGADGTWLSAAPWRDAFFILARVPRERRAATLVRAARAVNLTGDTAEGARIFAAAVGDAPAAAAQAPPWARADRGALVALPGGAVLLWWHKEDEKGRRWAWLHGAGPTSKPALPLFLSASVSQGRVGREIARGDARVLLEGMDAREVAQVALLHPGTPEAAARVAAMLERQRTDPDAWPTGCAILRGGDSAGVAWAAPRAYGWRTEHSRPMEWARQFGLDQWRTIARTAEDVPLVLVLADGLSAAQAEAFLCSPGATRRDFALEAARHWHALEAARHWHALGPEEMARNPPKGHEWAAAIGVEVTGEPDLGEATVFGGLDVEPGTLLLRPTKVGELDAFAWLRTADGWAYLSAPRASLGGLTLRGWPDDLGGTVRGSEVMRVVARNLSLEEQAEILLAAHEARVARRPFGASATRFALAEARTRSKADDSAPARRRAGLLLALAAEPWRSGFERRSEGLAAARGAFVSALENHSLHNAHGGALAAVGLVRRYVKHARGTRFLHFADWRGIPLATKAAQACSADGLQIAALAAAMSAPALSAQAAAAASARFAESQPESPVVCGARWCGGLLEQRWPFCEGREIDHAIWGRLSADLDRADIPRDDVGVYPYQVDASERPTALCHGGLVPCGPSTLLAVVGAARDDLLPRAAEAIVPRLAREARALHVRPGLVVLGPTVRGRVF